mmetsp:Transcript_3501/g.15596  ORF Transcript_3501/g.15596 Transcript_3501/m.15596 type:complete len:212 (+) Transcript_3501:377-1012(+)
MTNNRGHGRKQGPGLPFTPWDQILRTLEDPRSKLPENFQKSVASIFGAASKKRDAEDDDDGSRLGKTKKGKVDPESTAAPPKKETQASSFFADCPLCFKSFHPSLIVSHVDTCLGAAEETAPSQLPIGRTPTRSLPSDRRPVQRVARDVHVFQCGRGDESDRHGTVQLVAAEVEVREAAQHAELGRYGAAQPVAPQVQPLKARCVRPVIPR